MYVWCERLNLHLEQALEFKRICMPCKLMTAEMTSVAEQMSEFRNK